MIVTSVLFLLFSNLITALQFEGETCTLQASSQGRCVQVQDCEDAVQLLKENKRPVTCGFLRNIPLVCCPIKKQNVNAAKPGTLSQQKCNDYYNRRKQVYAIDIGQKALAKEFPHMAAVGYGDSSTEILWLCGGTLISHYFVLSAAHCVDSIDYGPANWIRLGDLDLQNTTEDANPQDVRIAQTYVHPGYKPSSHYHDIALFKMEKYAVFVVYFKPACLQIGTSLRKEKVQATGWGKLGFFGDTSSHLMKVDLNIVGHQTCARRYANVANSRKLRNGILDETQMCAGNAEGGDTCPGDSGGPLHYRMEQTDDVVRHFVVAGITSFGKGCGGEDSVGVYTRVSAYVGWIENIAWRENIDDN